MRPLPLSAHELAITHRVLAEEGALRRHLVVALSGAHTYGFPSPDSDVDLKAVHILPVRQVLGLTPPLPHAERMETIEGVEIDYSSNDIAGVLAGLLHGNGNYLERILGPTPVVADPAIESLRPLARAALTRRVHRHYHGFARQQARRLDAAGASYKHLLYVLRTALTGAHLLLTGEVEPDLSLLMDERGFPEARELIAAKRAGEKLALPAETLDEYKALAARAMSALDAALERSVLPEHPGKASAALEDWLIALRREELGLG